MNQPEDARPVILVAEDDASVRRFLESALPMLGFRVLSAANGAAAVAVRNAHPGPVAVALLDVRMPQLDGPQTFAALKALDPALPCLFMTGHPGDYTAEGLLAPGVEGILDKPFTLSHLDGCLRRILERPGGN